MSARSLAAAIKTLIDNASLTTRPPLVSATLIVDLEHTPTPFVAIEDIQQEEERAGGNASAGVKTVRYDIPIRVVTKGDNTAVTEELHEVLVAQIGSALRGAAGSPTALPLAGAADVSGDNSRILNFAESISVRREQPSTVGRLNQFEAVITVSALEGMNA